MDDPVTDRELVEMLAGLLGETQVLRQRIGRLEWYVARLAAATFTPDEIKAMAQKATDATEIKQKGRQ